MVAAASAAKPLYRAGFDSESAVNLPNFWFDKSTNFLILFLLISFLRCESPQVEGRSTLCLLLEFNIVQSSWECQEVFSKNARISKNKSRWATQRRRNKA